MRTRRVQMGPIAGMVWPTAAISRLGKPTGIHLEFITHDQLLASHRSHSFSMESIPDRQGIQGERQTAELCPTDKTHHLHGVWLSHQTPHLHGESGVKALSNQSRHCSLCFRGNFWSCLLLSIIIQSFKTLCPQVHGGHSRFAKYLFSLTAAC